MAEWSKCIQMSCGTVAILERCGFIKRQRSQSYELQLHWQLTEFE